jgi:integrase
MSVYLKKGSLVYTMDFEFQGQRIKESTGVRTKEMARKVERLRKSALEEGRAGVVKPKSPQLFAAVAEEYLNLEKAQLTPDQQKGHASTVRIDIFNLKHLLPVFGKKLLCDITPMDIAKYQQDRIRKGAAPKTINLELGTFRSITTEGGHWARLIPKIKMLDVDDDIGINLTDKEIAALLESCTLSESRILYPFIVMLLETGSRSGTVKSLTWDRIDFQGGGLRFGDDKTKAGSGRTVPISKRAMVALEFWAENFPKRKPHHFVFAREIYRQQKNGGEGVPPIGSYTTYPEVPITSLQRSWETALERTGRILTGNADAEPLQCRFHDLRHTAVSRMIAAKVPIPIIAQLVGWSASTMITMAARYGHYSMDTLRGAVETISGSGSPPNPHPLAPSSGASFL